MENKSEDYYFDLRGYIQIEKALDEHLLKKLNSKIDTYKKLIPGAWQGWVHRPNNPVEDRHQNKRKNHLQEKTFSFQPKPLKKTLS